MKGTSLGYKMYMQSPEWRALRKHKLEQTGGRCQGCSSTERLQAHHLTYERFGHERLTDLMILCHICHAQVHGNTPDVGPIAGETNAEMAREVKKREKMEDRQSDLVLAALAAKQGADFSAMMQSIQDAGLLPVRTRSRRKLMEREYKKLVNELAPVGLAGAVTGPGHQRPWVAGSSKERVEAAIEEATRQMNKEQAEVEAQSCLDASANPGARRAKAKLKYRVAEHEDAKRQAQVA